MGEEMELASYVKKRMAESASDAVVFVIPETPGKPQMVCRLAGDSYILVEYGEMVLDLNLRIKLFLVLFEEFYDF